MWKKLLQFTLCCLFLIPNIAKAEGLLLTIAEAQGQQTASWWPNLRLADHDLRLNAALNAQGLSVIDPSRFSPAPRLSPSIYSSGPLSHHNAWNLATLFSADRVLNGELTWLCQDTGPRVQCEASLQMALIAGGTVLKSFALQNTGFAPSEAQAKTRAIQSLAGQIALLLRFELQAKAQPFPSYNKAVIVFEQLPDADGLIALRRALRNSLNVEDVAELWLSQGRLAFDAFPALSRMTEQDFMQRIEAFLTTQIEGMKLRVLQRSPQGIVLEVLRY